MLKFRVLKLNQRNWDFVATGNYAAAASSVGQP